MVNFNIEKFLDLSFYNTSIRKDRRKNRYTKIKDTNEFFTTYSIVKRMCDKVDDETWSDPTKTWLEPGFGNGQYDVKDFLKLMEKKELEKKTVIKKFDICLMNPPYGTNESGNQGIHYEFVTKCNEITDRNIVVMPVRMIYATNNKFDIYKKEYNDILLSLDEIDAKSFNIKVGSLGIYNFDNKNGNNNNINISLLNGENNNVKSLFEISLKKISKYEQEILNYLDNNGNVSYYVVGAAGKSGRNPDFIKSQYKRKFNENDVLLLTNYSYGKDNPIFMTSRTGQIFKAGEAEQCEYAMKGYRSVIMKFNTFKEAENCKIALNNPVIRFGLYKLKDCQDLSKRVRKYIPNIDWSDDRVKTDEGLLEVCGCPKDKCKEYADYCKKIINEVDKGNRP